MVCIQELQVRLDDKIMALNYSRVADPCPYFEKNGGRRASFQWSE